jgi:hypothetical protein
METRHERGARRSVPAMNDSIIPPTVRGVLKRLARGADDRATALSVILLLRSLRAASAGGVEVEVSAHGAGVLVTVEHVEAGLWLAEILPVSMRALHEVLEEMPELLRDLERSGEGDTAVVRVRCVGGPGMRALETPVSLPSPALLAASSRATLPGEV